MKQKTIITSLEIIILLLTSIQTAFAAANDPGHDTLYIEQSGDSELSGNFNVTNNASLKGVTAAGAGLTLYGNGYSSSTGAIPYISGASGSNLYLETPSSGSIYLKYNGGGAVYVGALARTDLNVSGALYVAGLNYSAGLVCLSNGSNCPANLTGANVSGLGTQNTIAKFTGTSSVGNSVITEINSVNISVDSGVLFVDGTNSKVGIGTASPSYKLDINGAFRSVTASENRLAESTSYIYAQIPSATYGQIGVYSAGGAQNLALQSAGGNVGIGTASPANALEVNTTDQNGIKITSAGTARLIFSPNGGGGAGISSAVGLYFQNSSYGTKMMIDTGAGFVGIGTSSPQTKLMISDGSLTEGAGEATYKGLVQISTPTGTTGTTGGLEFKAATSGNGYGWRITNPDLGTGETPLYIQRRSNSASWTDTLTILGSNGNVGIGTTSPTQKLDVNGSINISSASGILYTPQICLNGDCKTNWPSGEDGNNYTQAIGFNKTGSTLQLNMNITGRGNLTTTITMNDTTRAYPVTCTGNQAIANTTATGAGNCITVQTGTETGNCSTEGSCSLITYDTELNNATIIRTITNFANTSTSDINVSGTYNSLNLQIGATGVTAASYGGATQSATITINTEGRITSASNTTITTPGDGNNYTQAIGFNKTGTTVQLNLNRTGMTNLTATFTDANTTYTAGNDIDLSGTQIDLEPALDYVGTINPTSGVLAINGSMNITSTTGCIYLPGGGKACGNSTCSLLYSPNGNTILEACN